MLPADVKECPQEQQTAFAGGPFSCSQYAMVSPSCKFLANDGGFGLLCTLLQLSPFEFDI